MGRDKIYKKRWRVGPAKMEVIINPYTYGADSEILVNHLKNAQEKVSSLFWSRQYGVSKQVNLKQGFLIKYSKNGYLYYR